MASKADPVVPSDTKEHAAPAESPRASDTNSDSVPVSRQGKRTWRSYLWDSLDKSPEERRFLAKLDAVVLTFASLGYLIKFLDQVNVNSAFVSGMKEDLGLYGNELNYMSMCWTVGYMIGEIPSNMLLTRVRPSIWIPACEVTWSVLTILLTQCHNATQIYMLRFFIGLAESGFYPGMQYVIGCWYRKDELGKRSCLFHAWGSIGSMFSGYLMVAVRRLDGRHGYHGWQWLFIINTVISLPIAVAGFFVMPDVPDVTRAFWLTDAERELARTRMRDEGRAGRGGSYTRAKFRKIFTSWHFYALTLLYIFYCNGSGYAGQPAFQLWLKAEGYDVAAVNAYPTAASAVTVVFTLLYAWTSDAVFRGARWPAIAFAGAALAVLNASLAAWDIPLGWKWACYVLGMMGGGVSGLAYAWAHEICSDDNEERALVVAAMNEMAFVVQAWLPLLVWPQVEAPRYRKGFITTVFLNAGQVGMAFLIRFLHHREIAHKARGVSVDA
ncbi:hypothetical protein PG993_002489 [Apiospora rasikravindrae]|uniref:Major facilitator superfamily (MFS) profile domain-containing protein n=1 Tax=Apiospora rasikravindrae TaxID=990691 RepID=A0ABR1TWT0_9PEZI